MIELKTLRFIEFDDNKNIVHVMLLTEDNDPLEIRLPIGMPEEMVEELVKNINGINDVVSDRYLDEDKINVNNIDGDKLLSFFRDVMCFITLGDYKRELEIGVSKEDR